MAVLIDTSILIGLERRRLTMAVLASLGVPDEAPAIAAITVSELLVGALLADTAERRLERQAFVAQVVRAMEVVPFDLPCAQAHAVLLVSLRAAGHSIGANDLLIAATAIALGHDVLTDNVREFGRLSGLKVRHPNWP